VKRAVVVVNRFWECDPVVAALLNETVRAKKLGWPTTSNHPRVRNVGNPAVPRLTYAYPECQVELWCLSDLLEGSSPNLQSSTEEKAKVLAALLTPSPPDLVIALGTAGYPSGFSNFNGCVVIGTNVFIHNGHPGGSNPDSNWNVGPFDALLDSSLTRDEFDRLASFDWNAAQAALVKTPQNPTSSAILASHSHVSLGTVNVTNYSEYATKDLETVKAFGTPGLGFTASSLETTHGLLRCLLSERFLFISGLTDRLGHFDDEVNVGQNLAASSNMGVVLSHIIASLALVA